MNSRFSLEIKLIVITLVILLGVVSVTGLLAYRNISSLVDSAGQKNNGAKLVTLKEIAADLSDANNSVHSYLLVKDSTYLEPFYSAARSIDIKLDQLYYWCSGDPRQVRMVDSLAVLVETRFNILRDFLSLDDDQRIVQSLETIAEKLEQNKLSVVQPLTGAPSAEDAVKKKSGIIKKIFGRKEKKEQPGPLADNAPVKEKTVDVKDMKGALVKARQEQLKKLQQNREEELKYTRLDKQASDRITALITEFEKQELDKAEAVSAGNTAKMRDTNRSVALVSALTGLLLLLMSLVILRYVRKSRAYNRALQKAKAEAEELARMKENFLASMSHEMRTPMNAIAGFTEQLQQTRLDDEQKRQLAIIRSSTEHLVEILNDVLDYSKLQAGKIRLQPVSFRPISLLKEIVQLVTPVAAKKQLQLSFHVRDPVPEVIKCDEMRLRQILLNLAGNAVKFTEKGAVKLEAEMKKEGETCLLVIRVSDTGIGIAEDKLEKIFEEFEQADENISKKFGGTGLGLSITRKLVELQKGSIEIESKLGKGTTITIMVPFTPSSPGEESVIHEKIMDTTLLKGRKVLIVDDEEYNRLLLIAILRKWGVIYEEAGNGIEAIARLEKTVFDAVLMDVRMPVMDGLETTRRIRKLEGKMAKVPNIAVTAAASPTDVKRCREAGFNDVLSKPFREMELYNKLLEVMNIAGGEGDEVPEKVIPGSKKYDLAELRRLAAGDEKFFLEMIRTFIDSTAEGVAQVYKYAGERNWEQTAHYSHKIAAPCRHMGAYELLSLLQRIEELSGKNEHTVEEIPRLAEKLKEESAILLEQLNKELGQIKV